jgi:hypothetical protein
MHSNHYALRIVKLIYNVYLLYIWYSWYIWDSTAERDNVVIGSSKKVITK